ncbi:sigma factor-like helix-turn-helix DNA-binding protein [Bacillus salacetis]|uniref:sigma factor-like helix-turn-helix DNA-binding protein n=1 Tax=Bacillus salacetis TaxID=2315464 RepID=UPI003BA0296F
MKSTIEDVDFFIFMIKREKFGLMKRYYNILHNKESEEYKRFINVYLKYKNVLSEREQLILDSVYGVNGTPLKLKEVGQIIKVTPERVRQLVFKSEREIATFLRQEY